MVDVLSEWKPKHPRAPRTEEVAAQLKQLTELPAFQALVAEMENAEEAWYRNFAAGLAVQTKPVDQREVDEKRGFWKGVRWALKVFPRLSAKEYDRFIAEALKESEARGGSH